ncbi:MULTISPECIES: HU family DNA-binding protein [Streptomyces]|uniref:HU family DNA-binding protein n=2 Tax=Streptomyces malaysiensis TaxID=92644 RepID=A0ABX6W571_STRMQ|nr:MULTISPECIES: HU family DNA-binding protein [Streptomyces]PNG97138.1 DNA-binding protein HU 2 [Streptomyces malaysiensis]QPI56123.1 HU family DNA-binding protein [Streptomyces solisilvae]UHH17594.1 HU family DNA-binding protein [Streptomyces sp. HNM0561]
MNKAQLINVVAQATGNRATARLAVESVLDAIVRAVAAGEVVSVTGFGSLTAEERPAHTARNPQTGERIQVGVSRIVKFRPGARFKDLVAGRRVMPESGNCIQKDPKTTKVARP